MVETRQWNVCEIIRHRVVQQKLGMEIMTHDKKRGRVEFELLTISLLNRYFSDVSVLEWHDGYFKNENSHTGSIPEHPKISEAQRLRRSNSPSLRFRLSQEDLPLGR